MSESLKMKISGDIGASVIVWGLGWFRVEVVGFRGGPSGTSAVYEIVPTP